MPYLRQRPRVSSTGRVTIRLTPPQRDLFIHSAAVPKKIGHLLHGAAVREGKLSIRLNRQSLEALIHAAAKTRVPDRGMERELSTLLRYLESMEDRFEDPPANAKEES